MKTKGLRKYVTQESSTELSPFLYMENWFDDVWNKPLTMYGPSLWSDLYGSDSCEISPNVDLFEEGDEMIMHVDLPGLRKEEINMDISENILTISGEKKRTEDFEKDCYHTCERSYGSFYRRVELPDGCNLDKINAHLENGVLELKIPMTRTEKTHKKITIH